jgi:predicted Zn-dependent protease
MAADLARERPLPIALVLARLSTFLAPDNGNAWVVAADVLTRGGQYDAALGALSKVGSDDVLSATARMRRAAILIETERARESIALLEAAANASGATTEDWSTLGEAYQRLDRHADAIKAYDRAISQVASPGAEH